MKVNIFRGSLSGVLAKTATLVRGDLTNVSAKTQTMCIIRVML